MSREIPGYTIPHHFSESEILAFIERHESNPLLQDYILTKEPEYGILVREDYGEILVWYDASDKLHVVDITNMAIANEIEKAPYVSPDDKPFWEDLQKLFDDLFSTFKNIAITAAVVIGLIIAMKAMHSPS